MRLLGNLWPPQPPQPPQPPYGGDRFSHHAFAAFFRVSRSGRFLTLKIEYDSALCEVWVKRFKDACEAISVRDPSDGRGLLPAFARRMLEELAGGIPTLWLLNNEQVQPPWGRAARIKAEETAV